MFRGVGDEGIIFTQPIEPRAETPAAAPAADADALLNMAVAAGCTALLPNDAGAPCLDMAWVQAVGMCKFGFPAPAGVNPDTWAAFCGKATACGWENFPGCLSYDAQVGNSVPACLDDQFAAGLAYCDQYPLGDGPDATLNALCWAAGKSATFSYNAHVAPLCSGASKAGMSPGLKLALIGGALVAGAYVLTRRR